MINWEEIQKEWESTTTTMAALAQKHGIPLGTLKSKKSRDADAGNKWTRVATTKEQVASINKKVADKVAEKSTSNATKKGGYRSNPKNQFGKRNKAAMKHGLLSRYLPKETLEIMETLDDKSAADIIWDQIQMMYASIIRSQQIMFVGLNEGAVKEINKVKSDGGIEVGSNIDGQVVTEVGYEVQFSWDRQATFMNTLARAMAELRNAVKQFNNLADEDDERRLKLQHMELGIVKSELEIDLKEKELALLNDDSKDKAIQINFVRK